MKLAIPGPLINPLAYIYIPLSLSLPCSLLLTLALSLSLFLFFSFCFSLSLSLVPSVVPGSLMSSIQFPFLALASLLFVQHLCCVYKEIPLVVVCLLLKCHSLTTLCFRRLNTLSNTFCGHTPTLEGWSEMQPLWWGKPKPACESLHSLRHACPRRFCSLYLHVARLRFTEPGCFSACYSSKGWAE